MPDNTVDILLVEDDDDDIDLTLRALRGKNIANHIHIARDGAEALDYLFGETAAGLRVLPKLIMLDLKLPLIDGIEVLRRIKADPRTSLIPVVVLTSSREESDLAGTYQLGTNSFIVKPVDFEQFVSAVEQIGFYWMLLNQQPAVA
ncbi:MAG: response regulator [Chloroflexi bacterium]|nr:response regulator [Chloroflexota bacterium]